MPAVSKAQQQAAGAALAAKKKGTTAKLKGPAKSMAKMSKAELEKYASTKHKGLPKRVQESITMQSEPQMEGSLEEAMLASNLSFWVVEKPKSPGDNPMEPYGDNPTELYYETDPFKFADQVRGGLLPTDVLGFYLSEDEAASAAHDQVTAVMEAAKALEEKKMMVTEKISKTISQLQKRLNMHLKAADENPEKADEHQAQADAIMMQIKKLRHNHKTVEESKKKLPAKDEE